MALKTGFFTILTLGFYRFWMKTRMRRFYWSAIRPGGHPMEYVGDPFEKLLGFFIAVVILTFYIGVINLLLMFASFSLFEGNYAGYLASFVGVIPLWFYARWRARRYVLGRTRWRGVRFAVEPAAWAYTWRALMHWGLTILSLGVLWPRMTFTLEKFRIEHTLFGDMRLQQGGRWTMLYRATIPFVVMLGLIGLWFAWVAIWQPIYSGEISALLGQNPFAANSEWSKIEAPERLWLLPVLLTGLIYGAVHYASVSKRIMANHKHAASVALRSELRPLRMFGIYSLGYTLAYLVLVVGLILLFAMTAMVFGIEGLLVLMGERIPGVEALPKWLSVSLLVLIYFTTFLMWSVCFNVFVTYPKMRHWASTLTLVQHHGLADVSQRARDHFAEAEGFAEALDLGAAI